MSIVGAFIDIDANVVNKHISSWTVFGTSPAAGIVVADFIRVTVVSIVVAFVDVNTFSVFEFVSEFAYAFKAR